MEVACSPQGRADGGIDEPCAQTARAVGGETPVGVAIPLGFPTELIAVQQAPQRTAEQRASRLGRRTARGPVPRAEEPGNAQEEEAHEADILPRPQLPAISAVNGVFAEHAE